MDLSIHSLWVRYLKARFDLVGTEDWDEECMRIEIAEDYFGQCPGDLYSSTKKTANRWRRFNSASVGGLIH